MSKVMPETEQVNPNNTHSTIIQGTVITGDLSSSANLRFDGEIKGTISCSAKVVIGKTAIIHGAIECNVADIYGLIEGNVTADELSLKSSAILKGDILTKQLAIEPGCKFSGNCNMRCDEPA